VTTVSETSWRSTSSKIRCVPLASVMVVALGSYRSQQHPAVAVLLTVDAPLSVEEVRHERDL
jgi:hypothetical protein